MSSWWNSNQALIQSMFVSILLAASIQIPLRFGVFSFAGIGSYGIGSYIVGIVTIRWGWSTYLALAAAAVAAALLGYLLSWILVRLNGLYLGMATIAFDLILSVVATNGGSITGGPTGLYGILADFSTTTVIVIVVAILILLALSERGRVGRRIDAVREDPELALTMGVPVAQMRRLAFVISGALGGVAGGMNTFLRSTVSPDNVSFTLVVTALTMIIIGGSRSWAGAVIGALIFTWLPTWLSFVGDWKAIVYGVLVTLAAVWVPSGILGVLKSGYRLLLRRRRPPEVLEAADSSIAGDSAEVSADRDLLGGLVTDSAPGGTR